MWPRRSARLNVVEDIMSSTSYIQRQRLWTRKANERKPSKHVTTPYTSLKQGQQSHVGTLEENLYTHELSGQTVVVEGVIYIFDYSREMIRSALVQHHVKIVGQNEMKSLCTYKETNMISGSQNFMYGVRNKVTDGKKGDQERQWIRLISKLLMSKYNV